MSDQSIASSPSSLSPATAPSIPRATAASTAIQNPGAARRRLLLEGPIVSTLLRLAIPNVVVNVVQLFFLFADQVAVFAPVPLSVMIALSPGAAAPCCTETLRAAVLQPAPLPA